MAEAELTNNQKTISKIILIFIIGYIFVKVVSSDAKYDERVNLAFEGKLDYSELSYNEQTDLINKILASKEVQDNLSKQEFENLKKDLNHKNIAISVKTKDFLMNFWKELKRKQRK